MHVTYDSGADDNYVSERDRKAAGVPILRKSTKRVSLANGDMCKASNVTRLPFPQLSDRVSIADTFNNFPTSLMSVGKTADDGTISIFTKTGVMFTKRQMCLYGAKMHPYSLECGMNTDDIAYHSSKREDNGSRKHHQRKSEEH